jgi:hypothetical protein
MDTIKLRIGTVVGMSGGQTQDTTREVAFEGEKLGSHREFGISDQTGGLTDTRGTTETLYKTADGRLVVYVEEWSHWQNEPNYYTLREVTQADLDATGEFTALGAACGLGRSLTLDEALEAG